tara:strand:+ start:434 stop:1111 length:678 start_codon:yes stop_codon:yes gene_type:complete
MTEILENGYGATLCSANQSEGKIKDCLNQDIDKSKFKLFGQNNLMYDKGTQLIDTQQSLGPGRYELDSMYGCDCMLPDARNLQLSQPVINFNAGVGSIGVDGCIVDQNSELRYGLLTNKNYLNQLPIKYNAGFFGKGAYNPNVESVIQGGNLTSFGDKACNVLSGITIPNYFTPMIPRLSAEVQNPIHLIPEDNSKGWVRGGIPSRDVYKLMDYNKRCDQFNKNN